MKLKQLLTYSLMVLFAASFSACSDSGSTSSGGNDKKAPVIPDLSVVAQPDISYFQDNNPKATTIQSVNGFNAAKSIVIGGAGFLAIGQIYTGFLGAAPQNEAKFKNGKFVWEYSYAAQGASSSVRTTAAPQGNGYNWSVTMSFDDGQGNKVTDYKIMDGTTSNDGNTGNWTFYTLGEANNSAAVFASSWNVTGDTQQTSTTKVFDESGGVAAEINYNLDGAKNKMTINSSGDDPIVIFWNTSSNAGYLISDSDQICWNGSFQDTSCSSLGF